MSNTESNAAVAAIQFALSLGIEGIDFLRMWNQGDFPEIREDWPECPDEVFIGADPLFKPMEQPTGIPKPLVQALCEATSKDEIEEMLNSTNSDGDGDSYLVAEPIWQSRSRRFLSALAAALSWLRDAGQLTLTQEVFLGYVTLDKLETLAFDDQSAFGAEYNTVVQPLRDYLLGLPTFSIERLGNQAKIAVDNHLYIAKVSTALLSRVTFAGTAISPNNTLTA